MKAYLISAGTGCTCCCSEDHYRGPYRTKEEAERRIKFYLDKDSGFAPLASQYAPRGRYSVREVTVDKVEIPAGTRWIMDGEVAFDKFEFVEVNEDGSINVERAEEYFSSDEIYV